MDYFCDWGKCQQSVCRACHQVGTRTAWCPKHRPHLKVKVLGWRVAPTFGHLGREASVGMLEGRSVLTVDSLDVDSVQIQARAVQEPYRRRVIALVKRLSLWAEAGGARAASRAQPKGKRRDMAILKDFLKHEARVVAVKKQSKRVQRESQQGLKQENATAGLGSEVGTRPSTVETWGRMLASAFPDRIRQSALGSFLTGLQSLAPAPVAVEREAEEKWEKAEKEAAMSLKRERTPEAAGLWLAIRLQRSGFRPLPAVRAAFPQSQRQWTHRKGVKGLLVSVLLDKDNKVGAIPAPRQRWLTEESHPQVRMVRDLLPLPLTEDTVKRLIQARRSLLRKHVILDARSSRRDAAQRADEEGLSVQGVLNHRPGSTSGPRYVGRTTSARELDGVSRW
jgi:hypothetical protein